MKIIWEPRWYELDQTIVVGDIDYFFLTKDKMHFSNGLLSEDDFEIKGEIISIHHKVLGDTKGIITHGLDYYLYLKDGDRIMVNAEEHPGEIYDSNYRIDDWSFEVTVKIIEETGISSKSRINMSNRSEIKSLIENRLNKYKQLLRMDDF